VDICGRMCDLCVKCVIYVIVDWILDLIVDWIVVI